jgi:hypothetical protein
MKRLLVLALAGTLEWCASGALYTYTFSTGFANGGVVPDGNPTGWSDTRVLEGIADSRIVDVRVTLEIAGGYNGDLYAYLVHGTGFTVLLNRPGTGSSLFGYDTPGFGPDGAHNPFTLSDAGDYDVNSYGDYSPVYNAGGQLTGTWKPAGGSFASFHDLDPNGSWTVFFADLATPDTSTVLSWGLEIHAVPEPTTWALLSFGALFCAVRLVRSRKCRSRAETSEASVRADP